MTHEKKNEFEIVEINETMLQSKIYVVRDQKVMFWKNGIFQKVVETEAILAMRKL